MGKFKPGDRVFLFDSRGPAVESDEVFAALLVPRVAEGREQDSSKGVAGNLEAGNTVVREEYQTVRHGVVGADLLFASAEECVAWYAGWLGRAES